MLLKQWPHTSERVLEEDRACRPGLGFLPRRSPTVGNLATCFILPGETKGYDKTLEGMDLCRVDFEKCILQ